jgi:serine/threonine protein phosphatase 1
MNYVISDPHGRYDLYKRMLEKIGFSDGDVLYILGDFADRGREGLRILLDAEGRKNVVGIIGNHDYLAHRLIDYDIDSVPDGLYQLWAAWCFNGGMNTLDEYGALTDTERERVHGALGALVNYAVVNTACGEFVLCHAGIANYEESKPLDEYKTEDFIFIREEYGKPKFAKEGKYLVTGHTPTSHITGNTDNKIYRNHDHIAIDCGAGYGGALACLCLDTLEEFYVE